MRRNVILLIVLAFLPGCSLLFSDGSNLEKEKVDKANEKIPTSIIKKFYRVALNRKGVVQWKIKAREARIFEKEQKVYLTDFIFYTYEKGKFSSSIRARRGILYQRDGKLVAKRLVHLISANGRTLDTEELYGNNHQKIIKNEVFNRITLTNGQVLTGTHLWAHRTLKVFKLKNVFGEGMATSLTNSSGNDK